MTNLFDGDGDEWEQGDDCVDTDPTIHPGAPEIGDDDIDNDCNGEIDESFDADQDGYDDVFNDGADCDDANPAVHPGATEVCGDGLDNDCDAEPDECAMSAELTLDDVTSLVRGASRSDRLGATLAEAGDQTGDGVADLWVGAPGAAGNAGAVYLVPGGPLGVQRAGEPMGSLGGQTDGDQLGSALVGGADWDGDGLADLIAGAPSPTRPGDGRLYLLLGAPTAQLSATDADLIISSGGWDGLGATMAAVSDVDDDGLPELALGLPYADDAPGAVALLSGGGVESSDALDLAAEDAVTRWLLPESPGMAEALAAGDFDGDGLGDLAVGMPGADPAGDNTRLGAVNVLAAGPDLDCVATVWGDSGNGRLGAALAAGDLDQDGQDDLLIGAPFEDSYYRDEGVVYLVLGPLRSSGAAAELAVTSLAGTADDRLGSAVAVLGDFDGQGSGIPDIAVSAPYWGDDDQGAVYVFSGPAPLDLTRATQADTRYEANWNDGRAGAALLGDSDWTGDGVNDLVVGAPQAGPDGAGLALVFGGAGL